jgi:hypothetical protein
MQSNERFRQLIETLDSLGFYRYALPDQVAAIKQASLETGELFPDFYQYDPHRVNEVVPDATIRAYFLDTEDLYERGAREFIEELRPALQQRGVFITSVHDDVYDGCYSILLNGIEFPVWSKTDRTQDMWTMTALRVLTALNSLLEKADSEERLFFRYGGNDMQVIFLTIPMYQAIRESNIIQEKHKPKPVVGS